MTRLIRNTTLLAALVATGLSFGSVRAQAETQLRIGYQKSSTLITVLKSEGELEKALAPLGVHVSWHEFANGLPLLEAVNTGNIDFSADVADTVPIFAQAAGAKLAYVAEEAASPTAQAILVPEGSPIKSVRDLKSKKVAVTKGAGSHYLLLAALAKAGLSFGDISPAYLTAADGRAAFVSGNVDAWVAWDPYLTIATHQSRAHILADGSNGLPSYKRYYLASAAYSEKHPDVLSVIYGKLHDTGLWVKKNPKEASVLLSKAWGIDARIIEESINHRSYRVAPVTISGLSEQQKIANAFTAEKLLPRKIDTADVTIWTPKLKEVSTGH